jgi:hypothetical protein
LSIGAMTIWIIFLKTKRNRAHAALPLLLPPLSAFVFTLVLSSCGSGANGSGSIGGGTSTTTTSGTPIPYTITVSGSPASISQPSGQTVQLLLVTPSAPVSSASTPSGAWEFVANSTVTSGSTTLIETDLSANGSQISASGPSQVQTATYQAGIWYVNGPCIAPSPGQNSVTGTVSGNSVSLTFNEGGNTFTGQGTLNGNTITGTYTGSNSGCSDSGTFTATAVPNLSGTFAGTLAFPDGSDTVTANLTEGSNYSLTFQTILTGADNGTFTFTGSAVANVAFVSGTINGNAFSLFGYYDNSGIYTGTPHSIAVFNYNTLANLGTLVAQ